MLRRSLLCVVLLLSYLVAAAVILENSSGANGRQRTGGVETPAERDQRMKWWREARFGMFIHWGLYAVPASGGQPEKLLSISGFGTLEWVP